MDDDRTGHERTAASAPPATSPEPDPTGGTRHRFRWFHDARAWIHARPHVHLPYRILVGIVGGLIIIIGLILVPLPGPGWLVVFIGLTVLASEFAFFHRISTWLRAKLHRFWDRVRRHGSPRMRAAADRGKSSVDDAHADANRTLGAQR